MGRASAIRRSGSLDLGRDALGEGLGLGEERVVARGEVDQPGAGAGAPALELGGDGEVLGAYEVRGGLVLPGDVSGRLGEGRRGLACQAGKGLLHGGLVAVLEEQLADELCVDPDGAVVARI